MPSVVRRRALSSVRPLTDRRIPLCDLARGDFNGGENPGREFPNIVLIGLKTGSFTSEEELK
jgi:hypothetical protein